VSAMELKLISRREAVETGLDRFFTGRPCDRGHVAERRTGSNDCLECMRERARESRVKNSLVELSIEELRSLLDFEPQTGALTWKLSVAPKVRVGSVAGKMNSGGYRLIGIRGKQYRAHRVAWAISYGEWPPRNIDHINGRPGDNRLCNLRLATFTENAMNRGPAPNNTSGYKGVSFHKAAKKWCAQISSQGRTEYLGLFTTPEKAHAAYCAAAKELHGEFARVA
jgi:hypothetical protein